MIGIAGGKRRRIAAKTGVFRTVLAAGAACFWASLTLPSYAQIAITIVDGENRTAPIVLPTGFPPSGATITVAAGHAGTQSGQISDALGAPPGGLVKIGAGTLTLVGNNTHLGGIQIAEGTVIAGSSNAFGSGAIQINPLGPVTLGYANGVTIANSIVTNSLGSVSLYVAAGSRATQAGKVNTPIFGGTFTKTGGGTLVLAADNFDIPGFAPFILDISAGTLEIGHARALGTGMLIDPQPAISMNGGVLRSAVTTTLTNTVVFGAGRTSTVSVADGQTLFFGGVSMLTLDPNSIAVFGSPTDTGTVVITAATFTADATAALVVAGGTLLAGNNTLGDALDDIASTTVAAGATLDFDDQLAQIHNLTGGGTVRTGANSATVLTLFNDDASTATFAGSITGAGGVAITSVTPTGTTILTGSNTYAGGTLVNAGATLQLGTLADQGSLVGDIIVDATCCDPGFLEIVNADLSGVTSITAIGEVHFRNASNAGAMTITTVPSDGLVVFHDTSSAGPAIIQNDSGLVFADDSTAATSIITNTADIAFSERASAGSASITNELGAMLVFGVPGVGTDTASAGNSVIVNRGGITIFAGMSTAANATITNMVDPGMLFGGFTAFAEASTAGNARIDVGDTGTVLFSEASNAGRSTIRVRAGGSLFFDNDSTAADSTIEIETGGIALFGANSTGGNAALIVAAGGEVDFSGSFGPNNDDKLSIGSLAGAGDFFLGPNELTVGSNNLSTEVSGVIADTCGCGLGGGALVKVGTGTLKLSGANTYSGGTTVNGGTLLVNGSILGPVLVGQGATLGGSGTVGNTVVAGTLSPGNSPGTLTVLGNLSFTPTGTYVVEVEPAANDLTIVTGNATLAGTLHLVAAPGVVLDVTRTILTASTVAGTFPTLTSNLGTAPFLGWTVTYSPANVAVTLYKTQGFAAVGRTANQIATGAGADSLGAGPLYQATLFSPSVEAALAAFDLLSGDVHASAQGALIEDSSLVRDAATARIRAAFEASAPVDLPALGYGEDVRLDAAASDPNRLALWGQAVGGWGRTGSDGNAAALDRSVAGFLAGGDAAIAENWRLGALAGYTHTNFDAAQRVASGSSRNFHAAIYGGGQWGPFGVRAGASHSWHALRTSRSVAFQGFTDALSAAYSARSWQVFGEAGYKMQASSVTVEPFVAAAHVGLTTNGFTETGGAAALSSARVTNSMTFTTVGARASTDFMLAGMKSTARGMVGWRHAFGDPTPLASLSFAGGSAFTVAGVPIGRDALLVEAGVDVHVGPAARLGLSYVGQFAARASTSTIKGDFSIRF